MNEANSITFNIGGKTYKLTSTLDEDYLREIASYVDAKIRQEMTESVNFKRLSEDYKAVMTEINIAEDYFAAKEAANKAHSRIEELEKELFDLRHEVVALKKNQR